MRRKTILFFLTVTLLALPAAPVRAAEKINAITSTEDLAALAR